MEWATLAGPVESELLIKKSRFLGRVMPVSGRAEAYAEVARLKALHPGAVHVCWALLAGGQSAAVDDGEPSGTAGRPMLDVLRHQQLEGVLATVVRYFGGIKLGAGGLVRAYTDTVATALQQAERVPIIRQVLLGCRVGYELEGVLRRELAAREGVLLDVAHAADVSVQLQLPEPQVEAFRTWLDDAGHGRVQWFEPEKADEA
ncbi:MAG: YigZ family protein [Lautropia mirabilis]|nr:YigZ family protein [Lautropia mirabilis]